MTEAERIVTDWDYKQDPHNRLLYEFYQHNDFKFKVAIKFPQTLCDQLNKNESLEAENSRLQQLIKEKQQQLDAVLRNSTKLMDQLKSAQELNRELVKGVDEIRDFMQRNIPSVESGVWPQWLDCRDKLEALLNKAK